jgi:hypothetical protein
MALVQDPSTGLYLDPSTGAAFHDPTGLQPSTDPSLTSQAQRSLAVSNQLLRGLSQYGGQYQQASQGQTQLGQYLQRTINGQTPSVASGQLQQGLSQIKAGTDSAASGTTGVNQGLARYGATQAYAGAAADTNQAAAIERAHETGQAVAERGALLGQQAGEAGQMYGQNLQGAGQFNATGAATGSTQAQIDQKNHEAWLNFISNMVQAGGSAAAKIGAA